jgi:uncharacterized protein YegL
MGFGKYYEDTVSRYVNDTRDREQAISKPEPVSVEKAKSEAKEGKKKVSGLKKFQMSAARPLPVIVLADTSASMIADDKIKTMNAALQDMVKTFADQSRLRAEIQVGLITFGGEEAEAHLPLTPAHQIERMEALEPQGRTPMGHAFQLATELLEDAELIPSRAYQPVLVLVSDGRPTDDWHEAFSKLQTSVRAQKASRFAMAIGSDADEDMLKRFANDPEAPLFKADNARDIHRFFRAVTMSVAVKSQSPNPDQPTQFAIPELPDDDPMDIEF